LHDPTTATPVKIDTEREEGINKGFGFVYTIDGKKKFVYNSVQMAVPEEAIPGAIADMEQVD